MLTEPSAWHTHAILLYRPAVLNTIAAAATEPLFHFYSSTPPQLQQNSHFRYFSPVQPARSARPSQPRRQRGEEGEGPRAAGDPMVFWLLWSTMLLTDVRSAGRSVLVQLSSKIFSLLLPLATTNQFGLRRRINTLLETSAWDSKGSRNSRFVSIGQYFVFGG